MSTTPKVFYSWSVAGYFFNAETRTHEGGIREVHVIAPTALLAVEGATNRYGLIDAPYGSVLLERNSIVWVKRGERVILPEQEPPHA
jgi:hypothetical protein